VLCEQTNEMNLCGALEDQKDWLLKFFEMRTRRTQFAIFSTTSPTWRRHPINY